jgi:hypothetical protein
MTDCRIARCHCPVNQHSLDVQAPGEFATLKKQHSFRENNQRLRDRIMRIFVKTLVGKIIDLDVEPGTTTHEVMQMIHGKTGVPPDQISLIFGNKPMLGCGPNLECSGGCLRPLEDYYIRHESTLSMVLRIRGGMTYLLKFEASECTITCKQQLELPRLTITGGPRPKDIIFSSEGATVLFSDTKRVAGTIIFTSNDPHIAEVVGSNILARSAGTTKVTATFSASSQECREFPENDMNPTCDLEVIVVTDT